MSKNTNAASNWEIVERWDVDSDGAEDMIVESSAGQRYLLARRHNMGAADPATWCVAFAVPAGTNENAVKAELAARGLSEHIMDLAAIYDVQEWPKYIVNNLAIAAR